MSLRWVLVMHPVPEMIKEAEEMRVLGLKTFKVKVEIDLRKDIEVIKLLRESLGPEVLIYGDANIAYSTFIAIRTIKQMEEYGLEFVEEPTPRGDWRGRLKIAQAISIPIMGDECVTRPQEVAREIKLRAIGII